MIDISQISAGREAADDTPNRTWDWGAEGEETGLIRVPAHATKSTHGAGWVLTVRCPYCRSVHSHCGGYGAEPRYGVHDCHETDMDWPAAVYETVFTEGQGHAY